MVTGLGLLLVAEGAARLMMGSPGESIYAEVPSASSALTRVDGDELHLLYQQAVTESEPISRTPTANQPRVVWMGGSSMRGGNPGMPREREAAEQVARLLDVESINMASPGLDTGHHLALLPDVLSLSPDAVVIYAGHNDLGNQVLLARFSSAGFLRVAWIQQVLTRSRLYTLLASTIRQRHVLRVPQPDENAQARVDEAMRMQLTETYVARLSAMVEALQRAGIAVVVATPASNPTTPSMIWRCPDAMATLGLQGRPPEAFPVHGVSRSELDALQQQEACADLAWIAARQDNDMETLDWLRDTDPLPFRAHRALVEGTREVARRHGAGLADVNAVFRAIGGGIEHPSLFNDPMHLSERGHEVLAHEVAATLPSLLGRPTIQRPEYSQLPTNLGACGDLPCRTRGPSRNGSRHGAPHAQL